MLSASSRAAGEPSSKIHLLMSNLRDQEPAETGLPLPTNAAAEQAQLSLGRNLL